MVGGPFVGELGAAGERVVHRESGRVREDGAQHARGGVGFDHAVEHRGQVRRDQMQPAICAVGGWHGGGGVRGPHRGGAGAQPEQMAVARGGRGEDLLVAAAEPELAQSAHPGTLVRGKHRLAHAERGDQPHLRKALQSGAPGIGGLAGVGERGDVSGRQPRVVVRRADDSVEVDLGHGGCLYRPGTLDSLAPPRRRASTRSRSRWWRRAAPRRRSPPLSRPGA